MLLRSQVSHGFLRRSQVVARSHLRVRIRCHANKTLPRAAPLEKIDVRTAVRKYWLAYALAFVLGTSSFASYAYSSAKGAKSKPALTDTEFKPFVLVSKEPVSSTSSIFTLVPQKAVLKEQKTGWEEAWQKGLWSVEAKQPQLQIARSYTPLPPSPAYEGFEKYHDGALRFLIRQEVNGEVSGYLHKLPLGATIELRGPHLEFFIDTDVSETLFIAGGTGIAPALQALNSLFVGQDLQNKRMHIMWANRRREECRGSINETPRSFSDWLRLLTRFSKRTTAEGNDVDRDTESSAVMQELLARKEICGDGLSIDFFVDEENSYIDGAVLRRYFEKSRQNHRKGADSAEKSKKIILLSGPDGFIKAMAGKKIWKDGREVQGNIGGLLDGVEREGWTVWKL